MNRLESTPETSSALEKDQPTFINPLIQQEPLKIIIEGNKRIDNQPKIANIISVFALFVSIVVLIFTLLLFCIVLK